MKKIVHCKIIFNAVYVDFFGLSCKKRTSTLDKEITQPNYEKNLPPITHILILFSRKYTIKHEKRQHISSNHL